MNLTADPARVEDILPWRDLYRQEMNCQIVHDSLHGREGWTRSYRLRAGVENAGYGSIVVGGPWKGGATLFEMYVLPRFRGHMIDFFSELVAVSGATAVETQTNDPLLTPLLHTFAREITTEAILFHDRITTGHAPPGARVRWVTKADAGQIAAEQLDPDAEWVVEADGVVAGTGGVLYHYNRPYGDVFMQIAERFRRRGLGAFLVQELKRECYDGGSVPAARCNPTNVASRRTLQKAGMVPCAVMLVGKLLATPP